MKVTILPPKMATYYVQEAKAGRADCEYGEFAKVYDFYRPPNQRITLVSVDPPIGHIRKLTQKEWARKGKED